MSIYDPLPSCDRHPAQRLYSCTSCRADAATPDQIREKRDAAPQPCNTHRTDQGKTR